MEAGDCVVLFGVLYIAYYVHAMYEVLLRLESQVAFVEAYLATQ